MQNKITELLNSFFEKLKEENDINDFIYNEFSFQHELGIFLRENLKGLGLKIQFERNVSSFEELKKEEFIKKEIDIVIFDEKKKEKYAIELKFPRNGQYPEQMYHFIKDIRFMEQLKKAGFTKTFAICLVDNHNFYKGNTSEDKIYKYFRNETPRPIKGEIEKPTGKENDKIIKLENSYSISWEKLNEKYRYYIVEI